MTNKTYLLVGVAFLLLGIVLGWSKGSKKRRLYEAIKREEQAIKKHRDSLGPVVYANKTCKAWTLLKRVDLQVRQVKERDKPSSDYYKDKEIACGALVVSTIYAGEPVVKNRAIAKDSSNKCLFELSKGKRGLALEVQSLEGEFSTLPTDVSLSLEDEGTFVSKARLLRSFQMQGERTAIVELEIDDALWLIPLTRGKKVVITALSK